MQFTN